MDRPKRAATKVTNFCTLHRSGDPAIQEEEMVQTAEELQQQLEQEKEQSRKLMEDAELMKLRNELETEKLKQKQWQEAMDQLRETKEHMEQEHAKVLSNIKEMGDNSRQDVSQGVTQWLRTQLEDATQPGGPDREEVIRANREKEAREKAILELREQQEEINRRLAELTGDISTPGAGISITGQEAQLQQLRTALAGRKEEDPNRVLLKAFIKAQNKTQGEEGTNTLKPSVLNSLTNPESGNAMADWLANLNKQEGELDFSKLALGLDEGRRGKNKSGILDKATTNIQQKQVWPQQNLGENWADEDVEFKQMKFEHLVAGETRTIETCSDPAQILGRLHLLRRIAYLKLRGYEWHLIRKMYAAILTSIETKEYSWESNFDRFETILYRRTWADSKTSGGKHSDRERDTGGQKRFCRDYNKPEGYPKNSPHSVWFGSGPGATKRTMYHFCTACLIRDKQQRDHQEGHPDCPHKD